MPKKKNNIEEKPVDHRALEIIEAIREVWVKKKKTQTQIADSAGISQTYISDLLSGKSRADSLTLKTLFGLFPNLILRLNGDVVSVSADNNSSAFGQVNGNINISDSSPEIKAITRGIMDTKDMSAVEKGRALAEFIKEIKK